MIAVCAKCAEESVDRLPTFIIVRSHAEVCVSYPDPFIHRTRRGDATTINRHARDYHRSIAHLEPDFVRLKPSLAHDRANLVDQVAADLAARNGEIVNPQGHMEITLGAQTRNRVEHRSVNESSQHGTDRRAEWHLPIDSNQMDEHPSDIGSQAGFMMCPTEDMFARRGWIELANVEREKLRLTNMMCGVITLSLALSRAKKIIGLADLVEMELQPLVEATKTPIRNREVPLLACDYLGAATNPFVFVAD